MRCPHCGFAEDKVIDSRIMRDGAEIRRRRECIHCGYRFSTTEVIVRSDLKVVKRDGRREDFIPEKIRVGIEKACWKRQVSSSQVDDVIKTIVSEISAKYEREVPTADIGTIIMHHLQKLDKVAYVRFASVYRDFQDVGEFIREIQKFNDQPEESVSAPSATGADQKDI